MQVLARLHEVDAEAEHVWLHHEREPEVRAFTRDPPGNLIKTLLAVVWSRDRGGNVPQRLIQLG
jgi:ligand-binding SRPBCC domain-containing protein